MSPEARGILSIFFIMCSAWEFVPEDMLSLLYWTAKRLALVPEESLISDLKD